MTYARARLWLGISGVGTIVVLSLVALWLNLPSKLLADASTFAGLTIPLAAYILVSFPFDFFGGYLLPRRHDRSAIALSTFLAVWLRGVLSQALLMGVCGFAILQAAHLGGTLLAIGLTTLLMLALLVAQAPIARLVGGMTSAPGDFGPALDKLSQWNVEAPYAVVYSSADPGFVGGLVGWPGHERLIVPSGWLKQLSPQVVAVQLARRAGMIVTGARLRGVLLALLWNVTGFSLASWLAGWNLADAVGLITTALWFTVWSFVGLLLLPSLSRPAVFESDQFLRKHGVPATLLQQAIRDLDQRQDNEPARPKWIERVFHPVPSVSSRIGSLQSGTRVRGAWQGARIALYLSWACFGFLSRAVHCNSGRPELWVLFPGD
jgi:hypothetical protein